MSARSNAAAAVALVALAAPAAADARGVTGGTITVNRGAAGISLGMPRADVVAKLGRPFYENSHGYMEYGRRDAMFDVYRSSGSKSSRVRMLGVFGTGFRLSDGNRIFARGGITRLKGRYGSRLKRVRLETGEPVYRIRGRYHGRRVATDFGVDRFGPRAHVGTIFIRFE